MIIIIIFLNRFESNVLNLGWFLVKWNSNWLNVLRHDQIEFCIKDDQFHFYANLLFCVTVYFKFPWMPISMYTFLGPPGRYEYSMIWLHVACYDCNWSCCSRNESKSLVQVEVGHIHVGIIASVPKLNNKKWFQICHKLYTSDTE